MERGIKSEIKVPIALADVGGVLHSFVYGQIIRGHKVRFGSNVISLLKKDTDDQPTFAQLVTIVQNGGSFEGIVLGLQFTQLASSRSVQEGVPGSSITEDEVTRQKTWLEWIKGNSQTIYERVNSTPKYYIMKGAYNGDILTSEQLDAARTTSGVTVIEWADHKARLVSEDYEKFES